MRRQVKEQRVRRLNASEPRPGPVVYWMSRDQRVRDNWALLYARQLAMAARQPLAVVFCLVHGYLGASGRQYHFMLDGLAEVEQRLAGLNIPMFLLTGDPAETLPRFAAGAGVGEIVTDFSPLKPNRSWKDGVAAAADVPLHEVDAHNIVPAWIASDKQEYGAYTIRPKLNRLLEAYMEEFPKMRAMPRSWSNDVAPVEWERAAVSVGAAPPAAAAALPSGEQAARRRMRSFLARRLPRYAADANDPVKDAQSGLSPYLHFGQLSAQRLALETLRHDADIPSQESFLEQVIVRRELSDNFCLYNDDYDNIGCFPRWARDTLKAHAADAREHLYSREEFEAGETHDDLWNAAQLQMVRSGRMHGYMRMYWAKKLLEWTASPEEAMETAIVLNDRYEYDGRDPNGYTGVAWSIGGVHDRAWAERPVFGKIRYMSYNGARSKFDVEAYMRMVREL